MAVSHTRMSLTMELRVRDLTISTTEKLALVQQRNSRGTLHATTVTTILVSSRVRNQRAHCTTPISARPATRIGRANRKRQ